MRGPAYTPEFFKEEIQNAELQLTQPISNEQRVLLQKQIATARKYLEDPTPQFKW